MEKSPAPPTPVIPPLESTSPTILNEEAASDRAEYLLTGDAGRISLDGIGRALQAGRDRLSSRYDRHLQNRALRAQDTIDRMDHKDQFYGSLGAVAAAAVAGEKTHTIPRVAPKSWVERRADNRVDNRVHKLLRKKIRRDKQGTNQKQTHGLRPMWSQQARRSEAAGRYKRGEISKSEFEAEKLRIRATRGAARRVSGGPKPVPVRTQHQRATGRKLTREQLYTQWHTKQSVMPHWRDLRRQQAERTARKAARRRTTP